MPRSIIYPTEEQIGNPFVTPRLSAILFHLDESIGDFTYLEVNDGHWTVLYFEGVAYTVFLESSPIRVRRGGPRILEGK
jgi:hypothetical protein